MPILKINNSASQISGLTVGQFKELKNLLSYDIGSDAAYFSGSRYNTKRSLLSKRGEFPTGLLSLVEEWRSQKKLVINIIDLRVKPPPGVGMFNLCLEEKK